MTTFLGFVYYLLPIVLGAAILQLLWPGRAFHELLLKASLAVGVGPGISSFLYFIRLLLLPGQNGFLATQLVLLAILLAALLFSGRRAGQETANSPGEKIFPSGKSKTLLSLFLLALGMSCAGLLYHLRIDPQGKYDAWAIYNLRARFIYRGQAHWLETFSPRLYWNNHPDYPLLLALNQVWIWNELAGETTRVALIQSASFMLGTIGLFFASILTARTVAQASLASLVLVGTPLLNKAGYSQGADLPVAFFILATCVLIHLYSMDRNPALLILSALAAGCAAWTKNDGLPLIPGLAAACAVAFGIRNIHRTLPWIFIGLLIPLAALVYFKTHIAPPNEFLTNTNVNPADISRYALILKGMALGLFHLGGWAVSIVLTLLIYGMVLGLSGEGPRRQGVTAIVILLSIQWLGYCAAYFLTPLDLQFQIDTSVGRLWFQLYPAVLFLFFVSVKDVEAVQPTSPTQHI